MHLKATHGSRQHHSELERKNFAWTFLAGVHLPKMPGQWEMQTPKQACMLEHAGAMGETDTADAPVKAALELGHSQHCRELGGRVAAEARVPASQLQQSSLLCDARSKTGYPNPNPSCSLAGLAHSYVEARCRGGLTVLRVTDGAEAAACGRAGQMHMRLRNQEYRVNSCTSTKAQVRLY